MSDSIEKELVEICRQINQLALGTIKGPECIKLDICDAKCCKITPDIPMALVKEYIRLFCANKEDFTKSNTLVARIKLNPSTNRCIFYNQGLNGCSLHSLQLKPPQCVIYPVKLDNKEHRCKKGFPHEVSDEKLIQINALFDNFFRLAREEYSRLRKKENWICNFNDIFLEALKFTPPSKIVGFKDLLGEICTITSQNYALEVINYCNEHPCERVYEECQGVCDVVGRRILDDFILLYDYYNEKEDSRDEFYLANLEDVRRKFRQIKG